MILKSLGSLKRKRIKLYPRLVERWMAILPESGSAGGFFLLNSSFFFPQSPCSCSGWEI